MENQSFQDLHWLLDIIQSTDIGIVVLDSNFDIEVFNRFMQVHGNINPEEVIGSSIFDVFPYLEDAWFKRRVETVFELGIPVYTTWEQRDSVFNFNLELPIRHGSDYMFQNTTFVPLRSSRDEVEKVGIIVYDVTDMANNKIGLEAAKDELLTLSRTDRLTGLFNRGHWEERLNEEFKRHHRSSEPVSLVMFDIDHFKKINDSYGHAVGDDAIRFVASTVLDMSREIDIAGRYGGEEFAVILPYTDEQGAFTFCERLRERIGGNVLKSHGQELSYTISLGIAMLGPEVRSPQEWLVSSDTALYASKEGGRNRTNIFKG
jgi:diguanylate cyclase (GGDEF)-like protein